MGSEMCIRDRPATAQPATQPAAAQPAAQPAAAQPAAQLAASAAHAAFPTTPATGAAAVTAALASAVVTATLAAALAAAAALTAQPAALTAALAAGPRRARSLCLRGQRAKPHRAAARRTLRYDSSADGRAAGWCEIDPSRGTRAGRAACFAGG